MPGVVPCALLLEVGGWARGALVFALPPKETEVRYGCTVWELARLWLTDELPRNSETWVIGRAVRHVRAQHREVALLVSYADPAVGHLGTIYRAANWTYDGMTDSDRKTPRFDYVRGGRRLGRQRGLGNLEKRRRLPKHRFIYSLGKARGPRHPVNRLQRPPVWPLGQAPAKQADRAGVHSYQVRQLGLAAPVGVQVEAEGADPFGCP